MSAWSSFVKCTSHYKEKVLTEYSDTSMVIGTMESRGTMIQFAPGWRKSDHLYSNDNKTENFLKPMCFYDIGLHIRFHYRFVIHEIMHQIVVLKIMTRFKGHLSWSFYFLYVLGIVNSHIISYILVSISSDLLNKTDI